MRQNDFNIPSRYICTALLTCCVAWGAVGCGEQTANSPGAVNIPNKSQANPTPEQRFNEILKKAETGDVKSQRELTNLYLNGEGVVRDAFKASEWLKKAADAGDATAQLTLGLMYQNGEVLPKNTEKALELLQKSATQGNADAQARLGLMYRRGEGVAKDLNKAVEMFQKASAQGNGDAMAHLGHMYIDGAGLPKNVSLGIDLISKSANGGNVWGQFKLGWFYWRGENVPKDIEKGLDWMSKSAAQGFLLAQSQISHMYWYGEDHHRNKILAYAWANVASSRGDENSKNNVSFYEISLSEVGNRVQRDMTPADIAEAQRISSSWKLGQILVREGQEASGRLNKTSTAALTKQGTGTIFFVTNKGLAITNNHVVNIGCKELRIAGRDGIAHVIITDEVIDLALIQIPGGVSAISVIDTESNKTRQGDDVLVFGFPLNSILSSGGNLTPGVVSALTGINNNTNQIQITAPIQPGSSGSPVMNKKGHVIGVVSMKLSDSGMTKSTGQVGQNVNFAVGGQTLKAFLDVHKVDYSSSGMMSLNKSAADIADEARKWTTVVECWK